ncbi:MAG: Gfo/Idh/MocA family oxidoreductase [Candidatus Latescibacterota bacterium]
MADRLAVAVIGCGGQGRGAHVGGWRRTEGVEVVAVCDADLQRAQETARDNGVPHAYADARELLERHRLDIVSVVTPPRFHKEQVLAAFAAGAHVLCEKPLAMSAAEAEEIVAAARAAGRLMGMALQCRTLPQAQYARQFIAGGGLGHVYHTRVWCGHLMVESGIPGRGVYHRREMSASGVLFATAVHHLDVANWVIGNPTPVSASGSEYQKVRRMKQPVIAWAGTLEDFEVEDFSSGFVRFADGSSLSLEANWLEHPTLRPCGVEVLGDYGKVSLFPLRIQVDEGRTVTDLTPAELAGPETYDFTNVLRDFAASVRQGRVPTVRFREMVNVQKILDGVLQSARTGSEVPIP